MRFFVLTIVSFMGLLSAHARYDSGYSIVCPKGDCPPAIAAVTFLSEDPLNTGTGLCSGTLIAPDRVLTNLHCLPQSLHQVGAPCSDKIQVLFPALPPLNSEKQVCQKVELIGSQSTSIDNSFAQDWAVIQLASSSPRPPAAIARSAIPMGTSLRAHPIYYNGFFPVGEIHTTYCQADELGYMFPLSFYESSPLLFAKDCGMRVLVGNSGAPLLNSQGEVAALYQSMVHEKHQSSTTAKSQGSPHLLGLKTLCLPLNNEKLPTSCHTPSDSNLQQAAIVFSVLRAFKASGAVAPAQSSLRLQWAPATPSSVLQNFKTLYPDVDLQKAHDYFQTMGILKASDDSLQLAGEILGSLPQCVKGQGDGTDTWNYTIFNYRDATLYPSAQDQLYLNTGIDRRLVITQHPIELPVEIKAVGDMFRVHYSGSFNPYRLDAKDLELWQECREEEKAQSQLCEKDPNCKPLLPLVPSIRCQALYTQSGISGYLRPFEIEIPSCAVSPQISPYSATK